MPSNLRNSGWWRALAAGKPTPIRITTERHRTGEPTTFGIIKFKVWGLLLTNSY
ncbi:MAG: hypothetical protein WBD99_14735 [Thermodesulfobacteriota bacterium]